MSQFPSLPLFTDAWVAATKHLTRLERGTYCDLLVLMWRSPGCRVPNDDAWLGKHLGMHMREVQIELRPIIEEFCRCEGNWIVQKRLSKEWNWCVERSANNRAAANTRWSKKKKRPSKRNAGSHSDGNAESMRTRIAPNPNPNPNNNTSFSSFTEPREAPQGVAGKRPADVSRQELEAIFEAKRKQGG